MLLPFLAMGGATVDETAAGFAELVDPLLKTGYQA
jgi:hypothetical protein